MLDAFTLDQLRTFVAIADCGSFRAAAAQLSRVQSAVSQTIAKLEAELGVAVFDRTGHRPVLTAEGRSLLNKARDVLLRVDVLRADARSLAAGLEPELVVAVDTLFPLPLIASTIASVAEQHPAVGLRLLVEPLGGPVDAIINDRCAAAVLVGDDFPHPRVFREPIGSIEQIAVVRADHPLAKQENSQTFPASAAEHLQIVLSDPTPLSEGRSFGVVSHRTCMVTTQEAKHAMISSGLGWGRLPVWMAEPELLAGQLVRLGQGPKDRRLDIINPAYLAWRLDRPLRPAAKSFRAELMRMINRVNEG